MLPSAPMKGSSSMKGSKDARGEQELAVSIDALRSVLPIAGPGKGHRPGSLRSSVKDGNPDSYGLSRADSDWTSRTGTASTASDREKRAAAPPAATE